MRDNLKIPVYGPATPLIKPDHEWLKWLNEEIWTVSTDRFGHKHFFDKDERKIKTEELERVLRLVENHRLPCMLHSGVYGNLTMGIGDHSDIPQVQPGMLIQISENHAGLERGFEHWNDRFEWFARYTHSKENRETLAFYKFPAPGEKRSYEY